MRVNGLEESENETEDQLMEKIVQLGTDIEAGVSKRDISIAHRLPVKINEVRQTIIKFTSRRAKMAYYSARMKLRDLPSGKSVFINEDLTSLRYKLLKTARDCPGFKKLSTLNGNIRVFRDGFTEGVTISKPSDLTKIGLEPDYKALGLC